MSRKITAINIFLLISLLILTYLAKVQGFYFTYMFRLGITYYLLILPLFIGILVYSICHVVIDVKNKKRKLTISLFLVLGTILNSIANLFFSNFYVQFTATLFNTSIILILVLNTLTFVTILLITRKEKAAPK